MSELHRAREENLEELGEQERRIVALSDQLSRARDLENRLRLVYVPGVSYIAVLGSFRRAVSQEAYSLEAYSLEAYSQEAYSQEAYSLEAYSQEDVFLQLVFSRSGFVL